FFFSSRRRHTRFSRDWSSDVCSSDLESLDELHGPTQGVVELPLHMAWSGMTSYDLSKPRQRMGLYRTVLHEGLHDDLPRYLNQGLLLQLWPVLRTLVGRSVRTVWEDAFPQLTSRTQAAA